MKKRAVVYSSTLILLYSCYKVPISGRRQLNMIPETEMESMALTSYGDFLTKNPHVPDTDPNTQMVKRVGARISAAVEQYMKSNGYGSRIDGYKWEFNLIRDDKTINAWCMPGGKVVVYTGLLPVTKNETALAVVMGHEIAHAVARHGNERMSQGLIVQTGGLALSVALSQKPGETQQVFNQAYNLGSTLGTLKYSRTHESEADKLGIVFMALAGYDPNEAVAFWDRMAAAAKNNSPEILSTHPSDETRIKDIKEFLPTALKYYKKPS
ncbi:MAG TPA: M48 family metallopeptidase [Bacteroidia bacterium]|nr:M48 family metallopeptidase [Bacteroidia bacterium]